MSTQVHHTAYHHFLDTHTNQWVVGACSKMRVLTLPLVAHHSNNSSVKKSVIGEGRYDVERVEEPPEPLQSNRCDGGTPSGLYGCFVTGPECMYWGLDKQECDQMNIRQPTTTRSTKKVRDDSVLLSNSNNSLSSSSSASSGAEKDGTRRTRLGPTHSSSTSSSSSGPSSPLSSPKRGTGGSYGAPPLPSLPQRRKQKQLCYGWLSPCINYTECPFAHSLDDLLRDFYTEETMQAVEAFYATQTQPYYQAGVYQQQRARLDRKRFIYLKRELSTCACEAINCPMRGNDHMKNKTIQVLTDPCRPVIHYCTVTCKMCTNMMRTFLPIYTLAPTTTVI
jgi:hypothetical protein